MKKATIDTLRKSSLSILIIVLLLVPNWSWACAVCERQQPKLLRGIIHGVGPEHDWDYLIIALVSVIVLATLYFSVKLLIRPGERSADHIKRLIIDQEDYDG